MQITKSSDLMNGKFVISLDFELFWGHPHKRPLTQEDGCFKEVHNVIPKLLEIFNRMGIQATFSAVGFLFFKDKRELLVNLPPKIPHYKYGHFSPYGRYLDLVGENLSVDPYHFGLPLLHLIKQYPAQEIGSHTFCHYHCLEEGQTAEDFYEDMQNAMTVAQKKDIQLTSIVFPQNQVNPDYLKICSHAGIICYRGTPLSKSSAWLHDARRYGKDGWLRRGLRFIDAYINLTGHNAHDLRRLAKAELINIPASRFLRPYNKKLTPLDPLRFKRIAAEMSYAAKHNLVYHLWWHPHNFGTNQDENFEFLKRILNHYRHLHEGFNFESITMSNLAKELLSTSEVPST